MNADERGLRKRLVGVGLLCLLAPSVALARDVMVANAKEFAGAVKEAKGGDVIVMKAGEWSNAILKVAGKDLRVRAERPGEVVLVGRSRMEVEGSGITVEGLYFKGVRQDFRNLLIVKDGSQGCRITECAFVDCNPPEGAKKESTIYLELQGTDHRVDHCYFAGKKTIGQTLVVTVSDKGPNRSRVDHNHFGPRPVLGENGGETIRVGLSQVSLSTSQALVERNLFTECDGEVETISNKSCDNIYRSNTFRDCSGTITLRHGNRCTVEGNFFFQNHKKDSGGIRVIGEDHVIINNYVEGSEGSSFDSAISIVDGIPNSKLHEYYQVKRAVIAFNTVVDSMYPMVIGAGHGQRNRVERATDCVVGNNVLQGKKSPLVTLVSEPVNMNWVGNVFGGAEAGVSGGKKLEEKLVRVNGLLVPFKPVAAEGDFPQVTHDIFGRERKGAKEVGCVQASSAEPIKLTPLEAKDVGPGWMKDR